MSVYTALVMHGCFADVAWPTFMFDAVQSMGFRLKEA
jgi:hypothetical protein